MSFICSNTKLRTSCFKCSFSSTIFFKDSAIVQLYPNDCSTNSICYNSFSCFLFRNFCSENSSCKSASLCSRLITCSDRCLFYNDKLLNSYSHKWWVASSYDSRATNSFVYDSTSVNKSYCICSIFELLLISFS